MTKALAKKAPLLKPCPFCGKPARHELFKSGMGVTGCSNIRCAVKPECWSMSQGNNSILGWNRRARK